MSNLLQKLSSRKLWVTLLGMLSPILIALGFPEDVLTSLIDAGQMWVVASSALVSAVYVIWEGRIDRARVEGGKE